MIRYLLAFTFFLSSVSSASECIYDLAALGEGYTHQRTLGREVLLSGVGVHSGKTASVRIMPAAANSGIVFIRTDLPGASSIGAMPASISDTSLSTNLSNGRAQVHTVEHLMSALYALGITNAVIEINSPEVPIRDGSSRDFVNAFLTAGIKTQAEPRPVLKVIEPMEIECGKSVCTLTPSDRPKFSAAIDFSHPMIGSQKFSFQLTPINYVQQISGARTFGFLRDVESLRKMNRSLGGSLENAVVFTDDGVMNPEGLRFKEEPARHKVLDAIGDLSLCGMFVQGHLSTVRGGHTAHAAVLKMLHASPAKWRIERCE